ncbi:MAG: family 78 glycoside hydrolase catalytic domain [Eubacteriales bacterium]|nr:family 78 glycoside hydrolase catalytic domain [Eubacteriales bacterium]
MYLRSLKCNRMVEPAGFCFAESTFSWVVEEAQGSRSTAARIEVSADPAFAQPIYDSGWSREARSAGTRVKLETRPNTRYFWRVSVRTDAGEEGQSEPASFLTGRQDEPWQAEFIQATIAEPPVFCKRFAAPDVREGILNICGLGLYEAYLNGEKIGDEALTPNCNDYPAFLQYQTYDVTPLLKDENLLEVFVGDGWYKGRFGLDQKHPDLPYALIAQLELRHGDGHATQVCTDESWTCRTSPLLSGGGIYDGEALDLNRVGEEKPVKPGGADKAKLCARLSPPVRVQKELEPQWIREEPDGSLLIDMGQNMAGWVSFYDRQPKGTTVTFQFGETLQHDRFYNDNYRTAQGTFRVTANGTQGWRRPAFTFFGFRYLRVTGFAVPLKKEDVRGLVLHSAMERTGRVETPNPKVNRLIRNALWSQRCNFIDVPTDCPQRDERLGWTGDAQVFSATATYNMDTWAFYRKYLNDLHIEQDRTNGGVPSYAPTFGETTMTPACSVWGDVITIIPDNLYRFYGDDTILRENYSYMKDWVAYIRGRIGQHHYLYDVDFHYGDWVALDGATSQSVKGGTEDTFVASVYFYNTVRITARAAHTLGIQDEGKCYDELAEKIRAAILEEYFTPTGRLAIDTQTAYIICLYFGIYADKERLLEGLRRRFAKDLGILKGGFVGAPLACRTLCENGMADMAYKLLLHEGFPGWLYEVNLGATTIWERWNSLLEDGSISGTGMNSLNHYAFGSVVEFLYADVAGLKPAQPGFGKAAIRPYMNARMPAAKASYDSAWGVYAVEWKLDAQNRAQMKLSVPFDASAELSFADVLPETLRVKAARGSWQAGEACAEFSAGEYEIEWLTKEDHAHPFDENSLLGDILDNAAACAKLRELLPQFRGLETLGEEERTSMPLTALANNALVPGCTMDDIQRVIKEIIKINVLEEKKEA